MNQKHIILLIGLACVIASFFGVQYLKSTPQYSLYKVYNAARDRDYQAFERYVDVDSVATHTVDRFLKIAEKEIDERLGDSLLGRLRIRMESRLILALRPKLQKAVISWLKTEVTTGGSMKILFDDVRVITLLTQLEIEKIGDTTDVSAHVRNNAVQFKMRKMGRTSKSDGARLLDKGGIYWQVYDIDIDPNILKSTLERI